MTKRSEPSLFEQDSENHDVPETDQEQIEELAKKIRILKEQIQKLSQDKRKVYFNECGDGIIVHDLKGLIVDVNQKACEKLKYSYQQLVGMNINSIETFLYSNSFAERMKELQKNGYLYFESCHLDSSGNESDVEVNSKLVEIDNKKLVISICRNIESRICTEKALQQSEERFRNLAESIPGAVYDYYYHVDGRRTNQFMGPGLEEIIEDIEEGMDMGTVFKLIHPEDIRGLEEAGKEAELSNSTIDHEYRIKTKSGKYKWIRSIGRPQKVSESIYHWRGVLIDVNKQKEIEKEKNLLTYRFLEAQKKESLSVLAGGIAHDFNNLLVGILGNASLAMMDLTPSSPVWESLLEIEKSAQQAADLTKQMLAYSGKGKMVITEFNLSTLLVEMTNLAKATVSKKAQLDFHLDHNLPDTFGDVAQIRQVIMNLLLNASESLNDKTGKIIVCTGSKDCDQKFLSNLRNGNNIQPGRYAFLQVMDDGRGMDKKTITRIFDPFFSTKFIGRGLGLAATSGIIEGHKGAIQVFSELGKGSSLTVYLPVSSKYDDENKIDVITQDENKMNTKGTILVADDEPVVLSLTRRILERFEYEVLTAADGRECVDLYEQNKDNIDIVILDLTMPRLNGEEAFDEIRKINSEAIVFLSSGYSAEEADSRFMDKGLSGFIQKPFKPATLAQKIQEALNNKI